MKKNLNSVTQISMYCMLVLLVFAMSSCQKENIDSSEYAKEKEGIYLEKHVDEATFQDLMAQEQFKATSKSVSQVFGPKARLRFSNINYNRRYNTLEADIQLQGVEESFLTSMYTIRFNRNERLLRNPRVVHLPNLPNFQQVREQRGPTGRKVISYGVGNIPSSILISSRWKTVGRVKFDVHKYRGGCIDFTFLDFYDATPTVISMGAPSLPATLSPLEIIDYQNNNTCLTATPEPQDVVVEGN